MSIHGQAHYKAMKDLIEIMAIASALGFIADCLWIVMEIMEYGCRPTRLIIMILLDSALILQMYALYTFHCNLVKSLVQSIFCEKKQEVVKKLRLNRRKTEAKKRGVK